VVVAPTQRGIARSRTARSALPNKTNSDVAFVKRDNFNPPLFSVTEDYGFADKFCLSLMERAEDR
jgi:hypothetical protein